MKLFEDTKSNQKLLVSARDITKNKRLEEVLIETGQQYRSILECIQEAIHVVNNDLEIVFINTSLIPHQSNSPFLRSRK